MGSTLRTAFMVLVAFLGSVYQLVLAPVIHAGGIFRKIDPLNNHACYIVSELEGCEKMVHQPESGLMYLACSRIAGRPHWLPALTHLNASGRSLDDHVATYNVETGKVTRMDIEDHPGAARGLQVHGMDVVQSASDPSLLYVYLVNHRAPLEGNAEVVGADSVIDIFSTTAGSSSLKHVKTVEDPVIDTPNDVVGFPNGKSFYFTNDHASKTGFWRHVEMYLNLSSANVGYCHTDHGCHIAAGNLKGANGITKSSTNDTIYVGSDHGAGVSVMNPLANHTLALVDTIHSYGLPMDNLSMDKDGAIWAAFFPRGLESISRFKDLSIVTSSGALRFTSNIKHAAGLGEKYNTERMFEDGSGIAMSATTVVYLPDRKKLFVHGASAPHLTICGI